MRDAFAVLLAAGVAVARYALSQCTEFARAMRLGDSESAMEIGGNLCFEGQPQLKLQRFEGNRKFGKRKRSNASNRTWNSAEVKTFGVKNEEWRRQSEQDVSICK